MQKFSAEDRSEAQEAGDYGREKTGRASLKEAITGAGRVQSKETQGTTGIDVPGSLTGEVGWSYKFIRTIRTCLGLQGYCK